MINNPLLLLYSLQPRNQVWILIIRKWPIISYFFSFIERFSYDLEKWLRWVFVICFISQWMKRIKHGLFVFPPKKTPTWRRYCSIGQTCCSMTLKRSIGWYRQSSSGHEVFSPKSSLNLPKATRVCTRLINQSKRSISVYLLFLFCLRVFISRSYENRSITLQPSFGLFAVEWALHKDKNIYILNASIWRKLSDWTTAFEPIYGGNLTKPFNPQYVHKHFTWLNPKTFP